MNSRIFTLCPLLLMCTSLLAQPWEKLHDMPVKLAFPVVVALNGNIHVMGGGGPSGATNLHLRYRPSLDVWDTMPPVPYLAQQPAGAVLNGRIHYLGGGYPNSGSRLNLHYYYRPDSNKWFIAANMPTSVAIHRAASCGGKLYSLSGQPDKALSMQYDPDSDSWKTMSPLPDQNFWYGAIVSHPSKIFRFGGGAYFSPATSAHSYNASGDTWSSLPPLPEASHGLEAALMGDSIIITGGYRNATELSKVWVYSISSQTYTAAPGMPQGRTYHGAVVIGSCVYAVGGNNNGNDSVGTSLIRLCFPVNAGLDDHAIRTSGMRVWESSGLLQFAFPESIKGTAAQIEILDLSGRKVWNETVQVDAVSSSVTHYLPSGCYVVRVTSKNFTDTRKLVIGY